jgi:hypothetical protein
MRRELSSTRKSADAVLRDIKRKSFPFPDITTVEVRCPRCGVGLLDLVRIPRSLLFPRSLLNPSSIFFQPPAVASPNDLYVQRDETDGWIRDGNTLRPTENCLKLQQRAREEARTGPRVETKRTRRTLSSHSRYASRGSFSEPEGKRRTPPMQTGIGTILETPPEWIECPDCPTNVRVIAPLAAHDAVM